MLRRFLAECVLYFRGGDIRAGSISQKILILLGAPAVPPLFRYFEQLNSGWDIEKVLDKIGGTAVAGTACRLLDSDDDATCIAATRLIQSSVKGVMATALARNPEETDREKYKTNSQVASLVLQPLLDSLATEKRKHIWAAKSFALLVTEDKNACEVILADLRKAEHRAPKDIVRYMQSMMQWTPDSVRDQVIFQLIDGDVDAVVGLGEAALPALEEIALEFVDMDIRGTASRALVRISGDKVPEILEAALRRELSFPEVPERGLGQYSVEAMEFFVRGLARFCLESAVDSLLDAFERGKKPDPLGTHPDLDGVNYAAGCVLGLIGNQALHGLRREVRSLKKYRDIGDIQSNAPARLYGAVHGLLLAGDYGSLRRLPHVHYFIEFLIDCSRMDPNNERFVPVDKVVSRVLGFTQRSRCP